MTWATVADMLARFNREDSPELAQITDPAGTDANEALIQAALDEAQAIIGGYLVSEVIIEGDAPALRRIQCNLARWTLYRDVIPDPLKQIYQADIEQLKTIARRDPAAANPSVVNTVTLAPPDPTYFRGF